MTAIASHLSPAELEAHYKTAADPVSKSHFHAIWLLSLNYGTQEVAKLLAFSPRWLQLFVKRYNEHGPDSLGDRRQDNGMAPAILTPEALSSLKGRLKAPPDGGALACSIPRPQIRTRSARLGCAYRRQILHPKTEAAPSQSGRRCRAC